MFSDLRYRLRSLFRRGSVEADLDEELRRHLELQVAKLVGSGMPPEEAARHARLQFGGLDQVKEECRDARGVHFLETLAQDVAFAVRLFLKTPVISAVALLSLALGIGANTAIFSLIDAVMLRALPVPNPDELVQIRFGSPQSGYKRGTFTNPLWEQLRDRQDVFSGVFAWSSQYFNLADGGEARPNRGIYASGDYFTSLGVRPAVGRLFTPADDARGCSGSAVLGYGFWQRHYGGAGSAVGNSLRLNGHSFEVIGVTQPGFFGTDVGDRFDVAVPVCAEAVLAGKESVLDMRSGWWLAAMGRLKPGVSRGQAAARLEAASPGIFAAALPAKWPPKLQEEFLHFRLTAVPGATGAGFSVVRDRYQRPLQILMILVGLVLLIACANIASLMVASAAARQREIAVRLSLGGSRRRLIRQVLTESLVLSSAGAFLGILFARWGSLLLVNFVSTAGNRIYLDLSLDGRVLSFTLGIAVLTGLFFGILPAFQATRVSLSAAVKGSDAGQREGRPHFRTGRWIVAAQVALSLVLLVGTVLFTRSFRNLVTLDPGFERSNVLLINMDLHNAGIPAGKRLAFYSQTLEALKAVPGAISVSQHLLSPMSGSEWNGPIQVEGYEPRPGEEPLVWFNGVTPAYFATLRTPLLRGRDFNSGETATSPPVAIVNETLARRFFPNADPIGRHLQAEGPDSTKRMQIVGLAGNSKYLSLREDFLPFVYVPLSQADFPFEWSTFAIRTAADPISLAPAVRALVGGMNKAVSLGFNTLAQQVDDTLMQERLLAALSGFFGVLALLLTAIGLYGVMAYAVTQRTREIGIRVALGASRSSILWLVMRDLGLLLAIGMGAGAIGAFWVARLVQHLLFGLTPQDVDTLGVAMGLLAAVASLATWLPARRAMRVDPTVALRYE
jgi:putative ABC transport system permease protein